MKRIKNLFRSEKSEKPLARLPDPQKSAVAWAKERERAARKTLRERSTIKTDDNPYVYVQLKNPRHVRVLQLFREAPEDGQEDYSSLKLYGKLKEVSIDKVPDYEALSYTWGDLASADVIHLDGHPFGITANCASALRRLLRGRAVRLVWVDAICINQASDPDALRERGQQVQMMAEIYQKATRVCVDLGPADEDSDIAMEALKGLSMNLQIAKFPGPDQDREQARQEYERLAGDALANTQRFPFGKLHGVFKRPWFQRVWVIQEVAMAKVVMFYCGDYLMRIETMLAASNFAKLPYSKLLPTHRHWMSYLDYHQSLQEFVRRTSEGEHLPFLNLGYLFVILNIKQATRMEDKVYALYGIAKHFGYRLPMPDYEKPVHVVWTEATKCVLEADKNLEVLKLAGWTTENNELPSWAMDLSGKWNGSWTLSSKNFHAALDSKSSYRVSSNGLELKVSGRRFNTISSCSTSYVLDISKTMLGGVTSLPDSDNLEKFFKVLGEWLAFSNQQSTYPTGVSIDEVCADMLLYDCPYLEGSRTEVLKMIIGIIKDFDHLLRKEEGTELQPQDLQAFARVGNFMQHAPSLSMIEHLENRMSFKRMVRSNDSFLGLAPIVTQENDIIVVFSGCPAPVILRRTSGGYHYLGTAYIHGIMDGEFWIAGSTVDDEWFTLV